MQNIELSPKQIDFINNSTHRFNGKIGATQCGKTFIDIAFVIPERILERRGKNGLNLILGVTKETIERNVLEPMRDFWGDSLVGSINSRNIAVLFGERVYCLGAEKVNQVSKLRGAKFKYCYCDELVEFNEEVFQILKSRMSLPYSVCDFTGNPSYPNHYVKGFIDSDADVYCQSWTLYDNPFLDPVVLHNLEREYAGTVYFDRYILGKWQRAEGIIYKPFADNPKNYFIDIDNKEKKFPPLIEVNIGFDPGGTKSKHALVATGITPNYKCLIALKSEVHDAEGTTPADVDNIVCKFVGEVIKIFGRADYLYWDNEASVLGRGVKLAVERQYPQCLVRPCTKEPINDRIDLMIRLLGLNMFSYTKYCETLKSALEDASWDKDKEDTRLDDGSTDIHSLDALEYSFAKNMRRFIQ